MQNWHKFDYFLLHMFNGYPQPTINVVNFIFLLCVCPHIYRDYINIQVLMLREKGELSKLEKKWFYDKGKCGVSGSSGSKASIV